MQHIIVCGHYGCGGIEAALEGSTTGLVDNWVNPIRELYLQKQREIDSLSTREEKINRLAELNVVAQVKNLYQTSILRKCMREGNAPQIHGWVLNLQTGSSPRSAAQNFRLGTAQTNRRIASTSLWFL